MASRKRLILHVIVLSNLIKVTLDFEIPCNASTPTIAIVPFCPNNTQTYKDAADKKNCSAIPHMCKSFVYHCVRNKEKNALIELCAPYLNFIGQSCGTYDEDFMSMKWVDDESCFPCPWSYNSTEQFKYPICYKLDEVGTTTALMSVAQSSENVSSPSFPKNATDKENKRTTDTQGCSYGLIAAVLLGTFIILICLWKGCNILRQFRNRNKTAIKEFDGVKVVNEVEDTTPTTPLLLDPPISQKDIPVANSMQLDSEEDSSNTTQSAQQVDLPITLQPVSQKDSAKKMQQESKQLTYTMQPVSNEDSVNEIQPAPEVDSTNTMQTVPPVEAKTMGSNSKEDSVTTMQLIEPGSSAKTMQIVSEKDLISRMIPVPQKVKDNIMRPDSEEDSSNTTQSAQHMNLPITLQPVSQKDSAKKLQQESKQELCHTMQPVPEENSANTMKPDSKVGANTIKTVGVEDKTTTMQQVDQNDVAKQAQLQSNEGSCRPFSDMKSANTVQEVQKEDSGNTKQLPLLPVSDLTDHMQPVSTEDSIKTPQFVSEVDSTNTMQTVHPVEAETIQSNSREDSVTTQSDPGSLTKTLQVGPQKDLSTRMIPVPQNDLTNKIQLEPEEDSLNTTQSVQQVDLSITLQPVSQINSANKLQQESEQSSAHTVQLVPEENLSNTTKPDSKVDANTTQSVRLDDLGNTMQQVDRRDLANAIELDSNEGSYRSASQSISQKHSMNKIQNDSFPLEESLEDSTASKMPSDKCEEVIDTNQQGSHAHSEQIVLPDDSLNSKESISKKNLNTKIQIIVSPEDSEKKLKTLSPENSTHQFIRKEVTRRGKVYVLHEDSDTKAIPLLPKDFSDILMVYARTTEDTEDSREEIILLPQAILPSKVESEYSENLIEVEFPVSRVENANEEPHGSFKGNPNIVEGISTLVSSSLPLQESSKDKSGIPEIDDRELAATRDDATSQDIAMIHMPENKWHSYVSEIKTCVASKLDLQTSHLEEMLKHIVKKTESIHENEIKKIYEEQRKELQKELSEKDSLIYRQNRDIMEKERMIMDLQKQLQAEKEDRFAKEKELFFLRKY